MIAKYKEKCVNVTEPNALFIEVSALKKINDFIRNPDIFPT